MKIFNVQSTKIKRRALRANQTEAEKRLWEILRNRQVAGYKFFRQYGIGPFIADFYCPELKWAIEIDGAQHDLKSNQEYDRQREKFMQALGIKTSRFSNHDLSVNPVETAKMLTNEINLLRHLISNTQLP